MQDDRSQLRNSQMPGSGSSGAPPTYHRQTGHQLPQASVDALQGFLLQTMQHQQQQQQTQQPQQTQQQQRQQQEQQQQQAQQHQRQAQHQQTPAIDLSSFLSAQMQPNVFSNGLASPSGRLNSKSAMPTQWPLSPLGNLSFDTSLMWPPTTSPTTLMAAELASGAWDDGGKLDTPLRNQALSDLVFSPSPHHRTAVTTQVMPNASAATERPLPDASMLLNSLTAWHQQQQQQQQPQQQDITQQLQNSMLGGGTAAQALFLQNLLAGGTGGAMNGAMAYAGGRGSGAMSGGNTPPRDCVTGNENKRGQQRRRNQPNSDSETSLDDNSVRGTRSRPGQRNDARQERAARAAMRASAQATADSLAAPPPDLVQLQSPSDLPIPMFGAPAIPGSRLSGPVSVVPEARSCHCKKSQCLKLYCDCFAAGVYCAACSCSECYNRPEHAMRVAEKREHIIQRDPKAFTRKIQRDDQQQERHKKGCNCKRSHCLKKYCECYQGGVRCSDACKCHDCHNQEDRTSGQPPPPHAAAATLATRVPSASSGRQEASSGGKGRTSGGRRSGSKASGGGDGMGTEEEAAKPLPWLQAPWTSPEGLGVSKANGGGVANAPLVDTVMSGGGSASDMMSPTTSHRLAQVPGGAGMKGMDGMGMTTPQGVRSHLVAKGADGQALGLYAAGEDAQRRSTPSTLRYPHSMVGGGGGSGDNAGAVAAVGTLRGCDSDPTGAVGPAPAHASRHEQDVSVHGGIASVKSEVVDTHGPSVGVAPQGTNPEDDQERLLHAPSEDLPGDDEGDGSVGGGAGMRDCSGAGTATALLSPLGTGLTGRLLNGGVFGPGMMCLGSPGSMALDGLMGGGDDAVGSGGMMLQWQELLAMPSASGCAGKDGWQMSTNGDSAATAALPAWQAVAIGADPGKSDNGSPLWEPGGVHALVSPVRTSRDSRRTVGVKRALGGNGGGNATGAPGESGAAAGNIPTSPALDALASVAAAEQRGGGMLCGGAGGCVAREGILLLPQSPSKRSALGSGPQPSRPAASRNPALPPLSSRQQPPQPLGQASKDTSTDVPVNTTAQLRGRLQPTLSGPAHSQSSVGSPAAAPSGGAGGVPITSSRDALKAQANDYIAARCRGISHNQAAPLQLPPLSLPPLSGGATHSTAGAGAPLARSNSVPVPPPSHPIPGLSNRPSHTSSATTATPPTQPTGSAITTSLPQPAATAPASAGPSPAGETTNGNTAAPQDQASRGTAAEESETNGADGYGGNGLDMGPTSAMALLCGTPWGDAGNEGGCGLDSFLMSPMAGWDSGLLLMSPRMTTPLYAKAAGASLNSPFFAMSPTRWWPGATSGGLGGLGLASGPLSAGGNALAALGQGPMSGLNSLGALNQGPMSGVNSLAALQQGLVSESAAGGGGGQASGGADNAHSLLAASQLLRMTPGTTVLSPTPAQRPATAPSGNTSRPQV